MLIEDLVEDSLSFSAVKGKVDQRRHPRIPFATGASINLADGGSPLSGMIENVSAGGCLMRLQCPPTLRQGAIVDLAFQIKDLPIKVRGQVRAIQSETKIGFEFHFVNEKVRRELETLVQELLRSIVRRFALGEEQEECSM